MIRIQKEKTVQLESNYAGYPSELAWRLQGDLENKEISIGIGYDLSLWSVREQLEKLVRVQTIHLNIEMKHYDTDALCQLLSDLPNIRHLGLSEQPRKGSLLTLELPYPEKIESISFANAELPQLPVWLNQLSNLKNFRCYQVVLEDNSFQHLKLEGVEQLYFRNMPAQMATDRMAQCPKLRHLVIADCGLTVLPEAIQNCKALEFMDLSDNPLTVLPEAFKQLTQLRDITLPKNQNLNIHQIFDILRHLPHLATIRSDAPLKNWLEALPKKVDLPFAKKATILEIACAADLKNLALFPNLTHLTIERTPSKTIAKEIGQLRALQFLKIHNSAVLETLPNVFEPLQQLETVELRTLSAFKKLPNSFYKSKTIKRLQFNENYCKLDFTLLKHNTHLQRLDYDLQNVYELLALPKLSNLERLYLSSAFEVSALPETFQKLKKLKDFGFKELHHLDYEQALKQLPFLESVRFDYERFKETWILPKPLQYLSLSSISLSVLLRQLEGLPHLKRLNLEVLDIDTFEVNLLKINQLDWMSMASFQMSAAELPLQWVLLDRSKIDFYRNYHSGSWETEEIVKRVLAMQLPSDALKMRAFGLLMGYQKQVELKSLSVYKSLDSIQLYMLGNRTGDAPPDAVFTEDWQQANYIVLGAGMQDDLLKQMLLADKDFVLENDLKQKVLQISLPFLMDEVQPELIDRISELILAHGNDNTGLVLELIRTGGAEKRLLSYLTAIHLQHPDPDIQQDAQILFQKYASDSLQAHVRLHKSSSSQPMYWHPDIDFFDAFSVVKVIHFRRDGNYDNRSSLLLQNTPDWVLKQDGFHRISLFDKIIWGGPLEVLDFQYFMMMIRKLAIRELRFEKVDLALDLNAFWLCESLTSLWMECQIEGLTLTIPMILTAPLESLCLFGFQFKDFHHLIPYLPQFEVLQLGNKAPN
jgi:Leucine-rich repeat (LRR) protein